MKVTTVHVMRHGEVDNPHGILYGRIPGYHLSERGQEMARLGAKWLVEHGEDIRAVVSSPLERAQETASHTAKAYDLPVLVNEDLIETANQFEGKAIHKDPRFFLRPENLYLLRNPLRPSWGEPYQQVVARMVRAVRSALEMAEGGSALVVSHQIPIWEIRLFLERRHLFHDPRRRECSLASFTSLTFEGRTIVGIEYIEPAAAILSEAVDVTPGKSSASTNRGN